MDRKNCRVWRASDIETSRCGADPKNCDDLVLPIKVLRQKMSVMTCYQKTQKCVLAKVFEGDFNANEPEREETFRVSRRKRSADVYLSAVLARKLLAT